VGHFRAAGSACFALLTRFTRDLKDAVPSTMAVGTSAYSLMLEAGLRCQHQQVLQGRRPAMLDARMRDCCVFTI
jgi:hypothetical protein